MSHVKMVPKMEVDLEEVSTEKVSSKTLHNAVDKLSVKNRIDLTSNHHLKTSNQLTHLASTLFTIINKLSTSTTKPKFNNVYKVLTHQLQLFFDKMTYLSFDPEKIAIAHYTMCLFIDDVISGTKWGNAFFKRHATLTSSVTPLSLNPFQQLAASDQLNIDHDLLELFYLCLSFGYKGQWRDTTDGEQQLTELQDKIFDQLNLQQETLDTITNVPDKSLNQTQKQSLPILKLTVACVLAATIVIAASSFIINQRINQVDQKVSYLIHTEDS